MWRITRFFTIVALALPVLFLAGELVARAFHFPGMALHDPVVFRCRGLAGVRGKIVWHQRYFWTLKPDIELKAGMKPGEKKTIRIDSWGFRTTPWRYQGVDAIRWIFLGDSMVLGWSSPPGKSFPDVLVSLVAERYDTQRMASFNLGIPAHSSYQTLKILRGEFDRVKPDIVVYWGGSNDNAPANGYCDRIFARLYAGPMYTLRHLLDKSAFIRWTRTLYLVPNSTIEERPWEHSLDYPRRVDPPQYFENIKKAKAYCEHRGARFLAITRQHARHDLALDFYNAMLQRLEREDSLVLVDIRDMYRTAPEDGIMKNYPQDKCHFNAKGNRRVAECVATRIIEEGWIDELMTSTNDDTLSLPVAGT